MKTRIVCPTDFSSCSVNAARYASQIAQGADKEISLVHVCPIPVVEVYTPADVLQKLMKIEEEVAQIKLDGLKEKLEEEFKQRYKTAVLFGDASDQINIYAEEGKQDIIIMGSHGQSNNILRFVGSVSYGTVKRANTPCMVIPCSTDYEPIEKVLVAWDESHEIAVQLGEIYRICNSPNPSFTIATVVEGEGDDFCKTLNKEGSVRNVQLRAGSVADAISRMLDTEDFDALALFRQHRSFIENLLHKSTIKKVLGKSDIPVLIYNH